MLKRRVAVFLAILALLLIPSGVLLAADIHWGYDGDIGPAHWGALNPDWAVCASGQRQSPIDIPSSAPVNPADLAHTYNPSALNILNNGHTIQVNYDAGSTLVLDGESYELLQFHFHAPSEHAVDGNASPMEMHLVHRNATGGLAVIGVFLEEGAENNAFAPIFANLPASESEPEPAPGVMVNAEDLLPADQTYWRYSGSLTTPPCSEDVKWLVMNTPVTLSAEQISAFTAIYDHNARPVQAMNGRDFIIGQQPDALPETGGTTNSPQIFVVIAGVLLVLASATTISAYRRRIL